MFKRRGAHADWGVGAVANHGGFGGQVLVLGVQTCYLTVIFNAEVNGAAVGIGKADDGFNQALSGRRVRSLLNSTVRDSCSGIVRFI